MPSLKDGISLLEEKVNKIRMVITSGMRGLLRYYDVVFGNFFSKEPT